MPHHRPDLLVLGKAALALSLLLSTGADTRPSVDTPASEAQGAAPFLAPPVAQHGGSIRVIEPDPDGRRLWIGHGPRVAAVDVADPAAPRVLRQGPVLDGVVQDIAVEGDRLAVAAGPKLYTMDVDAEGLEVLGAIELGDEIGRIAVHRGVAYALLGLWGASLDVVDLRDPTAPARLDLALLDPGERVQDLLVRGDRLYVAIDRLPLGSWPERDAALRVFALADPARPERIALHADPAWGLLAAPADGAGDAHIFGLGAEVLSMDLSDPTAPIELARWGNLRPGTVPHHSRPGIVVDARDRPFVVLPGGFGGSHLYEPDPDPAGEGWAHVAGMIGDPAGGFAAFGERLAFAEWGGRISLIDSRPAGEDSTRLVEGTLDLVGDVMNLAFDPASPDLLAVATDNGLGTLALGSSPELEQLGFVYDGHYHLGLSVSGRVAAMQDRGAEDFGYSRWDFVDLRDPRRPRKAGRTGYAGGVNGRSGSLLFVPESGRDPQSDIIGFWDIADPDLPRRIGSWPQPHTLVSVDVDAGRLAAASVAWRSDLERPEALLVDLIDVTRPEAPRAMRQYDFGSLGEDFQATWSEVGVEGDLLFLITARRRESDQAETERGELSIFDLDAPSDEPLARIELDSASWITAIAGGYLFTADRVIDVRQPSAPRVVARVPRGQIRAVDAHAGRLFARDFDLGLWVYEPELDRMPEPAPAPPTYTPAPTVTLSPTPVPSATPTRYRAPSPTPKATGGTQPSLREILLPILRR